MKFKRIFCGIMAMGIIFAAGCQSKTPKKPDYIVPTYDGSRTQDEVGFQFDMPEKGETIAVLNTNMGDIKLRLFEKSAPIAVTNFKALIQKGYYDGVIFHRVIKDFMIQGGDPEGTGIGGESVWGKGFENEFNKNLLHFRGALSMAHTSQPNSNGSQFFIVHGDKVTEEEFKKSGLDKLYSEKAQQLYYEHGGAFHLDGIVNSNGHTVFGHVFEGMDVVDKIATTEVDGETPVQEIKIIKAYLTEYKG